MPEHCPTCGGAVEICNADEGTSYYRPSRPHLVTDEMVERAVGGYREVAGRCSRQATRAALEAALGGAA